MFNAYEGDTRSRGTCTLFDKVTRSHHEMTDDCRNSMDEVVVTLHTHEQENDAEDGTLSPKGIETVSIFLPHDDVNETSILQVFKQYKHQFVGYLLADWYWANNPCHEF